MKLKIVIEVDYNAPDKEVVREMHITGCDGIGPTTVIGELEYAKAVYLHEALTSKIVSSSASNE
jgi:hypothetical protein